MNFEKINKLIEKKIVNNFYYNKNYIRRHFNDENILIIDNNNTFFSVVLKKLTKRYRRKSVGHSFLLNNFYYKNNKNKIFFNYIQLRKKKNKVSYIKSYYTALKKLVTCKKLFTFNLILLKRVKGGYICFFQGMKGFLPRSQYVILRKITKITHKILMFQLQKIYSSFLFLKTYKIKFFNRKLNKKSFLGMYYMSSTIKLALNKRPNFYKNQFTSGKKRYRRLKKTKYNIVFTANIKKKKKLTKKN